MPRSSRSSHTRLQSSWTVGRLGTHTNAAAIDTTDGADFKVRHLSKYKSYRRFRDPRGMKMRRRAGALTRTEMDRGRGIRIVLRARNKIGLGVPRHRRLLPPVRWGARTANSVWEWTFSTSGAAGWTCTSTPSWRACRSRITSTAEAPYHISLTRNGPRRSSAAQQTRRR